MLHREMRWCQESRSNCLGGGSCGHGGSFRRQNSSLVLDRGYYSCNTIPYCDKCRTRCKTKLSIRGMKNDGTCGCDAPTQVVRAQKGSTNSWWSSREAASFMEVAPAREYASGRRELLAWVPMGILGYLSYIGLLQTPWARSGDVMDAIYSLEKVAGEKYADRDFGAALDALNRIIDIDGSNPRWYEYRANVLLDAKMFTEALDDFDVCLRLLGTGDSMDKARVMSSKALCLEGIGDFVGAIQGYEASARLAELFGAPPDPYVLNSLGNCHASLGEWKEARRYYLDSAAGFQNSRVSIDGVSGSMQRRLDASIYAFSNASLMLAQLGDDVGAIKEMQNIARRAPGSADIRAALAAQFWAQVSVWWHLEIAFIIYRWGCIIFVLRLLMSHRSINSVSWCCQFLTFIVPYVLCYMQGNEIEAEREWNFACSNIVVGCTKYTDEDWLVRIRRWPPVMVERLRAFRALQSSKQTKEQQSSSKTGFFE